MLLLLFPDYANAQMLDNVPMLSACHTGHVHQFLAASPCVGAQFAASFSTLLSVP